jgi:hypothetical protein
MKDIVERVRFPSPKDIGSALMMITKMNGNNFLYVLGGPFATILRKGENIRSF